MSLRTKGAILIVIVAVAAVWLYNQFLVTQPSHIVETLNGNIQGIVSQSREGKTYYQYLGIPYGQPPTGELRFEDPLPASKWNGVYDASSFGPECLQLEVLILGRVVGNEDCLYLNVFTPQAGNSSKLVPVLVYLHGGLFMGGSSNLYQGKYFVDEDVILVTLNYRVAALGFLTTGDGVLRGNQGLKDQTLALKWIKHNIESFGGDPNKITLFGESAGGASAHYQMISSLARGQGLFQKVISMSGNAVRVYLSTSDQVGQLKHFGEIFGCVSDMSEEIVACLKKVDGHLLVQAHKDASDAIPNNKYNLFVPTIETVNDTKSALVSDARESVEQGNFERIPWLTGVVAYEGLLYVARIIRCPDSIKAVNAQWETVLPKLLKYDSKKVEITRKIKEFYFGNIQNLNIARNIHKLADMFSDRLFIHPTYEAARLQSKFSPVFVYYLSYPTETSVYQLITSITPDGIIPAQLEFAFSLLKRWVQTKMGYQVPRYGPSHGDELSLLFNLHFLAQVTQQSPDYEFSRAMVKLWASFAKDENSMDVHGARWLPINPDESKFQYVELNINGKFLTAAEKENLDKRIEFWKNLNLPYE